MHYVIAILAFSFSVSMVIFRSLALSVVLTYFPNLTVLVTLADTSRVLVRIFATLFISSSFRCWPSVEDDSTI